MLQLWPQNDWPEMFLCCHEIEGPLNGNTVCSVCILFFLLFLNSLNDIEPCNKLSARKFFMVMNLKSPINIDFSRTRVVLTAASSRAAHRWGGLGKKNNIRSHTRPSLAVMFSCAPE